MRGRPEDALKRSRDRKEVPMGFRPAESKKAEDAPFDSVENRAQAIVQALKRGHVSLEDLE